jgi:hypothetical protein
MIQLPKTLVEAEALRFAREWIARCQEGDFLSLGYPPLHPDAGRAFARHMIKQYALTHPFNMTDVVDAAYGGSEDADIALRELVAEIIDRGEALPTVLGAYAVGLAHPSPRLRGKKRATNILQDISIVTLIMELVEQFGLKPTRNPLAPRPSACSIAATAMAEAGLHRGAEKAIAQIWRRYSPAILPVWRQECSQ